MATFHERYHHRAPVTAKTLLLEGELLICVLGGVYTDERSIIRQNTVAGVASDARGGGISSSGGIHVGDGIPTTISDTAITVNSVSASDPNGEPTGFDSGLLVGDSALTMSDTVIQGNNSTSTSATTADSGPGGSAIELDGGGTIRNTRITQNTSTQHSLNGVAGVNGALAVLNFNHDAKLVTVSDSLIAGNTAKTTTPTGTAITQGAGIFNDSLLKLTEVQVRDNSGQAHGPTSIAHGGGIFNSDQLVPGAPVQLTLDYTDVMGNKLSGTPGATLQGGGLFTTLPVTLNDSRIADNQPDQCYGCTLTAATSTASVVTRAGRHTASPLHPGSS